MLPNTSRGKLLSPLSQELEAKIVYLNEIGFRSNELAGIERTGSGLKFYFEKQRHSAVNVADLWSIQEQKHFLKAHGLVEAERERIKRARMENTGVTLVKDRIMHDKFLDTIAYSQLPKLTVEVNKLRNKPLQTRRLETFTIYSRTHTRLERPNVLPPKHYEEKIDRLRTKYFPLQPKKDKLEGLIATCEEIMRSSSESLRNLAKRPRQLPTKVVNKQRQDEQIARKVKKLLDNDFNKI
jgi:hypothetical protein